MENFENERYISSYFAYLNKQRANPAPEPFKYQPVKQSSKIKEQIKALAGGDIDSGSLSDKILTLSFEEREKFLALLLELFNLTGDTDLLSLIDLLKKSLDDSVKKEKADKKDEKAYTEVDRSNENARQKAIEQKAKNYGDYAFEKAKNSKFSATTKPTVDTKNLDQLSRNQIVSMFRPHIFYSLSASERHKLFQAVVNEYCRANGVSPCAVNISPLPYGEGYMTFGEYYPCKGSIAINSHLFDNLEAFSDESDPAFPYAILQTLIHETEHRIQFMNIDNTPKNEADRLLKESLLEPQQGKSFEDYLAEPDEIGARNAALAYFRNCANECDRPEEAELLACFYNCQKQREMYNGKSDVSNVIKKAHQDIYNEALLHTSSTLQASMRRNVKNMMNIALGNTVYSERTLQK